MNIPALFDVCETALAPAEILVNNHTHCAKDTFDPAAIRMGGFSVDLVSAELAGDHFAVNARSYALMVADELYAGMRGPGESMTVLSTAYSDPANKGTGYDEPMLIAISYGKGRVFHTLLGHDTAALSCVGFITTFQRGTEWTATGKVTQKVPDDFPTADKVSTRKTYDPAASRETDPRRPRRSELPGW